MYYQISDRWFHPIVKEIECDKIYDQKSYSTQLPDYKKNELIPGERRFKTNI